jgi:hypothetical protein
MFSKLTNKKDMLQKFVLIFAIIITIFSSFTLIASAGQDEAELISCTCGNVHSSSDLPSGALARTAYIIRCTVETGNLFAITGDVSNFDMESVLTFDISSNFNGMWELAETGYRSLIIVGQILASIFFVINLSDKVFSEQFNGEKFFLELAKFFMTLIILSEFGLTIITYGIDFVGVVFTKLIALNTNPFTATSSATDCMADKIKQLDNFDCLFEIITNILPYIAMLIAQFCVKLFAWKRILEILVRVICAPIGMADPISGGVNSSGIRYFKKLMALILQGPLIYAVSIAYAVLKDVVSAMAQKGDISFSWIITVLLMAVAVTLIQKTDSLSKELVGV